MRFDNKKINKIVVSVYINHQWQEIEATCSPVSDKIIKMNMIQKTPAEFTLVEAHSENEDLQEIFNEASIIELEDYALIITPIEWDSLPCVLRVL